MKSLRIASLLFLLVIGPVLSSYSQNIYLNYPLHIYYKNNKYDCSITPPINADSTQMRCIMFSWTPYGGYYDGAHNDFKLSEQEISVKSIGDTVWLKMINLVPSNNTKDGIKTWIRGIKEGDKIRFKDTEPIGHSRYDLHEYEYVIIMDSLGNYDSVRMDTDSIIGKCDTIYQKSVTVGEKSETRVENHSWWGSFKYAEWPFEYCNMDIIAEYNPDTGLMKYPDHELLVRPLPQYYPAERDYPYITNWALRDEMAIKDFIITRGFATKEPISLPAPEVTYYKRSSWAGHGGMYISDLWIKCNIYMDLITEDGEVLDRSQLKVMVYMDDITDGPLNGDEYINPFKKHPYYTNHSYYCGDDADAPDLKDIANNVEVMVYYEKEDGTRIESPRVRAVDVSGLNDIQADPITTPTFGTDDKIYDLTGRIVNPDNLTPGIYIRNGRKFLVR